jgi:hypothetical protein
MGTHASGVLEICHESESEHTGGVRTDSINPLAKGNPKSVQVANAELSHTIKPVIRLSEYFDSILQPIEEIIDILDIHIKVDFPAVGGLG